MVMGVAGIGQKGRKGEEGEDIGNKSPEGAVGEEGGVARCEVVDQ